MNYDNSKNFLSEDDIITLQKTFLTCGFSYLKFDNIIFGRFIINKILRSLNYYNNIACLTSLVSNKIDNDNFFDLYFDLYKTLCNNIYNENDNKNSTLTNFFLNHFDFDFLWIELSQEIVFCDWLTSFEKEILDFNVHKTIPIIAVSYD